MTVGEAASPKIVNPTKQRLIEAGLRMLLEHGYNDLGIQALLDTTRVPKGSFYHHFRDKEDFALQVIGTYMSEVHEALDACLEDEALPPLARVRRFFELSREKYREEGYLGCLLGGLGQELSGVSETFRRTIEECFSAISARIAECFEQARRSGEIPLGSEPGMLAERLVDCWEGAALRCRLRRDPGSLNQMLDFYFGSLARVDA